ncbi:DUF469 family protein [Shewanella cyperi]|uniref:DUF469 family protein n=1 Tax=Shewanella cyperi TaxID=2814292 RepID=A0A974XQ87_9GAMM|nr:50S ribosome-binding protein YggL [Shewanella cyperi]QSX28554.1 DUF469 family protein [Shewanella cyperi]
MATKRKRRLRKKLYLEEFAVFGFEFTCKSKIKSDEETDHLLDAFLEFIESRNLMCGGGFSLEEFSGFLCSDFRYRSATDEDRSAVEAWLMAQAGFSGVVIGELVDANYGI